MRVAVVGAGVSGLAAVKSCREEGFDVVCFERRNDLGGLWNYTENVEPGQSNVTRSTVTITSKELTCYSDFPMPGDFPNYMHNSKLLEYFRMYADHFRLQQYIRFETEVVSVEQQVDGSGRWSITTRKMKDSSDTVTEIFDAVMVCVGIHSNRNMPIFEGQDEFKGKLIHSVNYRHEDSYRGKRVVVVGVGPTACDTAVDLSGVCSQVYLSVRNGAWFVRRVWDNGLPLDLALFTRCSNTFVHLLPSGFVAKEVRKQVNARFNHALYGLQPRHSILSFPAVTNDDLPSRILSGSVQVRPGIARLMSSGVRFTNGTFVDDVDAIICATGYSFGFPFVKHESFRELSESKVNLYKYMFAPDLQPQTLAVIGCVDPMGPNPPVMEMQCRVAIKVFKGDIHLPDSKTMWDDVRRTKAIHEAWFKPSTRQQLLVQYIPYMDDLSRMIGCSPPSFFRLLLTDPRLAMAVYFGLTTPYQYRLVGPGAWCGARDAILSSHERILQPLKTRSVVIATSDNKRRSLLLKTLIVGALLASAWTFYQRRSQWNWLPAYAPSRLRLTF